VNHGGAEEVEGVAGCRLQVSGFRFVLGSGFRVQSSEFKESCRLQVTGHWVEFKVQSFEFRVWMPMAKV